ncbi:hypothetical protein SAMN05216184_103249 [Georgenia satyanarayanai]|uniref:Lasso RiPP family leader peptide-containing protein n=1 Tax=Georgenia satyanarayanai TaxID=860221 RepID=A0A2Y9A723_9MICO|nr:lasso RiPP family leader peptide-containing protein [Georgenia satyanarayanai]PYG00676.1 hypothetical protein A8987_103249 [Georgenia satyanarayanai]SSA40065.1 hypothetical protein SAMN05216184_103249 [Georgenia satyanarayanai]
MYTSPRITEVGSVPELTLALTGHGRDDQVWLFKFGDKPDQPPVGS